MIVKVTEVIKKNDSHRLVKWVSTNQGAPRHVTVSSGEMEIHVAHGEINPGDELFASGTLDSTTGITYSLTIDKTRGNCPFGNYEGPGPILSGVTNTSAMVRLKVGGSGPYAS